MFEAADPRHRVDPAPVTTGVAAARAHFHDRLRA
jgi:hypothetical protein